MFIGSANTFWYPATHGAASDADAATAGEDFTTGYSDYDELPASVTFTRSSLARMWLDDGTMGWAPHNTMPESFTSGSYNKRGTATVTADVVAGPPSLGGTADQIDGLQAIVTGDIFDSLGGYDFWTGQALSVSIWIKRISTSGILTIRHGDGPANGSMTVDLAAIGSDWVRVTTAGGTGITVGTPFTVSANNVGIWLHGPTGSPISFYTTRTQMVLGALQPDHSTAYPSHGPRIELSPQTGKVGLLIEGSRTNLLTYSQQVSSAWTDLEGATSDDNVVAPDGTTTADTFTETAAVTSQGIVQTGVGTSAATYTYSFFVKYIGRQWIFTHTYAGGGLDDDNVWFDIQNGVVGTEQTNVDAAGIEAYANDWYRCWVTVTLVGTPTTLTLRSADADNDTTCTGINAAAYAIWGWQLELGEFPSSYIATGSGTATRADESAIMDGVTGFVSDQGTLIAEWDLCGRVLNSQRQAIELSDGSSSDRVILRSNNSGIGQPYCQVKGATVTEAILTGTDWEGVGPHIPIKAGVSWIEDNCALMFDGHPVPIEDNVTSNPINVTITRVTLGARYDATTPHLYGHIYSWAYYDTRKTDDELRALTLPTAMLSATFESTGTLPTGTTFTRSTVGTYFDVNGVMQEAAIDAARFDYNQAQSTPRRGLLIEEQRENEVVDSTNSTTGWTLDGVTRTAGAATFLDGTTTALRLTEVNADAGQKRTYPGVFTTTAAAWTMSFFAKKETTRSWAIGRMIDSGSTNRHAWFDLTNGVVGTAETGLTASMVEYPNGWYRCVLTISAALAGSQYATMGIAFEDNNVNTTGDNTETMLFGGMQVELGATASSYIATTTVAVTRGADVCKLTGLGYLNPYAGTLAVEYSFSSAAKSLYREPVGISDNTTDNRVGIRGDNSGQDPNWFIKKATNTEVNDTLTYTFAADTVHGIAGSYAQDNSAVSFNGNTVTSDNTCDMGIDLTQVTFGANPDASGSYLDGHIYDFTYYGVNVTDEVLARFATTNAITEWDFETDGALSSEFTFTRSTVGTYFDASGVMQEAAIDAARFETNVVNGRVGLLIEGSRTNQHLFSEQFDNAEWTPSQVAVTANDTTAPDGTTTADKIVPNGITAQHYINGSQALTAAQEYCISIFAKPTSTDRYLKLTGGGLGGANECPIWDVNDGILYEPGTTTIYKYGGIEAHANGWYRCWVYIDAGSTSAANWMQANNTAHHGGQTWAGDSVKGLWLWGSQQEEDAEFPSSYIATTTVAVTRAADVCEITGNDADAVYNDYEGTLYAEVSIIGNPGDIDNYVFGASDGSTSDEVTMYHNDGDSDWRGFVRVSSSTTASFVGVASPVTNVPAKLALGYLEDSINMAADGSTDVLDASGTVPAVVTQFDFGQRAGGTDQLFGHLYKCSYRPWRVSDEGLETLTT